MFKNLAVIMLMSLSWLLPAQADSAMVVTGSNHAVAGEGGAFV